MNRHARKRFANKVTNFIWSAVIFVILAVIGFWVITNWVLPWFAVFNDAV
ncbi:MAG: hypothetical protein ISS35_07585 [Kiritimatiellae bacterium]|nr:hypothetical protein [Kiritimatiellia bacterium]